MLKKSKKSFQVKPLETMVAVGMVSHDSARVWMRSHRPGKIHLRWWKKGSEEDSFQTEVKIADNNASDNTCSVLLPAESGELIPLTEYYFAAEHSEDGRELGRGRFETFPATDKDTPERFSIGVTSCHQPFLKDGRIRPDSSRMLTAVKRCMEERNTKFLLMTGDQMYADFPEPISLFNEEYFATLEPFNKKRLRDCSPQTVRRIYQERYRIFWNHPQWQALKAEYPCLPILDDHDILDNWGSRPVYQRSDWQSVGEGGRWAYFDYQGTRVSPVDSPDHLPDSFHYDFCYGNTATFLMDLRSQRTAGEGGQLYSPEQQQDLEDFLKRTSDKKVIFLVLSVPIIHLPRFISQFAAKFPHSGEDFSDRWSSGAHINDRDRMLKILCAHSQRFPSQKIVLLSGDIHIGCAHVIKWQKGGPDLYQLISSPVTHKTPYLVRLGSKLLIKLNRNVMTRRKQLKADVRLLDGVENYRQNPYGGRNIGMVEVHTPSPGADPSISFIIYGQKDNSAEEPVCVYQSPPL